MKVKGWMMDERERVQSVDTGSGEDDEPADPYSLTDDAITQLHLRAEERLWECFPTGPPWAVALRINRELAALWGSPATYGLLVADEVVKELRGRQFTAYLEGVWQGSYYAWLMRLVKEDPLKSWERGPFDAMTPLEIRVFPSAGRVACRECLRRCAYCWGFYLFGIAGNAWKLISLDNSPDDIYARHAPVIAIK